MRSVGKRRKLHPVEVDAHARAAPARALRLVGGVVDQQLDPLAGGQLADDLAVDPGDRPEAARPVGRVVRPGEPGRLVRLPLGGHARAGGGGVGRARAGQRSVEEALLDAAVGVDAAVAQERPVAPHLLDAAEVALADQDLLLVDRGLGHDHAERVAHERRAPELEPGLAGPPGLVADPVDRRHVDAVGDGVRRAGWSPRRRAGRRRTRPSRAGASRWRSGRTAPPRPAAPSAARPPGYHWSQQTSVPMRPAAVSKAGSRGRPA